jgi:hypothetical protein
MFYPNYKMILAIAFAGLAVFFMLHFSIVADEKRFSIAECVQGEAERAGYQLSLAKAWDMYAPLCSEK